MLTSTLADVVSVRTRAADDAVEMVHQNPRGALELALEISRSTTLDVDRGEVALGGRDGAA